jgi:DNA-binding HxlR family transcriptional regulator
LLARALDVVGDRWNLLIVRQLLMAPARYRELLDGLPGVATNLLTGRLRDLEAAGVVERRLAEQGNSVVYGLTAWGAGLREPVESLVRWSTPLMMRGPGSDSFRPEWLAVALPALLSGLRAQGRPDAPVVLGLAAGLLTLDDSRGLIGIDGDEAAVRGVFGRNR